MVSSALIGLIFVAFAMVAPCDAAEGARKRPAGKCSAAGGPGCGKNMLDSDPDDEVNLLQTYVESFQHRAAMQSDDAMDDATADSLLQEDDRDDDLDDDLDEDGEGPDEDELRETMEEEEQTTQEIDEEDTLHAENMERMKELDTPAFLNQVSAATASFDCADEIILRLAMSKSFEAPESDLLQCAKEADAWAEKNGPGSGGGSGKSGSGKSGSGKSGSGKSGSGGSGRTGPYEAVRGIESKYSKCQQAHSHRVSLGPRLVRMTGHDAADYRNTIYANGTEPSDDDGGVDTCLHSALISQGLNTVNDVETVDEEGNVDAEAAEETAAIKGDPNHNKGLGNAVAWVLTFSEASKLSRPDVEVLGASVYIEAWVDGPELGFKVGRNKGKCSLPVCLNEDCWTPSTQFFKGAAGVPVGAGNFCPYTNSINPLKNILGLTVAEFVALQGAHSLGGVMMCSGMGDVSSGPFCPGRCDFPKVLGSTAAGTNYVIGGLGFGGTSFDATPGKLDNEYFKQLVVEKYATLPDCDQLEASFPHIQRGGSGGGGSQIINAPNKECGRKQGRSSVMCKDRHRPDLGNGIFSLPDAENTCKLGARFKDESQCDVGSCAEKCDASQVCQDAQNVLSSDAGALKKAWVGCNACKMSCRSKQPAMPPPKNATNDLKTCRNVCKSAKAAAIKGGMSSKKAGGPYRACKKKCKKIKPWKAPKSDIIPPRPAKWCKELPPVARCTDPKYSTGNRRGATSCGQCPPEKCVREPNIGGGRNAHIKSVDRWTKYRGIVKRVMVLPSDWSYLADPELMVPFTEYANDNDKFKEVFATAWKKVTQKGSNVLNTCKAVRCTATEHGIECPVQADGYKGHNLVKHGARAGEGENSGHKGFADYDRPEKLLFSSCSGANDLPTGVCDLIGAKGLQGKFRCLNATFTCSTEDAVKAYARIAEEWKTGGGQDANPESACNHA